MHVDDETRALLSALTQLGGPSPLQTLCAMVSAMPGTLLVATDDGDIMAASRGWSEAIGMEPADLEALGWAALLHPDDAEGVARQIEAQHGRPTIGYRLRWVLPDGREVPLEFGAAPWADVPGGPVTLCCVRVL